MIFSPHRKHDCSFLLISNELVLNDFEKKYPKVLPRKYSDFRHYTRYIKLYSFAAVPVTGGCNDDPGTNCSRLSAIADIYSDIQHAKTICRKYCGLCA